MDRVHKIISYFFAGRENELIFDLFLQKKIKTLYGDRRGQHSIMNAKRPMGNNAMIDFFDNWYILVYIYIIGRG